MRDYQTKTNLGALPDSNSATKLGASEATSMRSESKNAVTPAGLVLAPQSGVGEDVTQLAQSIFIHSVKALHFVDGGAVNTIELTPISGASGVILPPIADNYTNLDGAHFTFDAAFTNTVTGVTVSIGQTAGTQFASLSVTKEDGSALGVGDIDAAIENEIRLNLGSNRFELVRGKGIGVKSVNAGTNVTISGTATDPAVNVPNSSATTKGAVELATNAETQAGADTTRAVTPAGLLSIFAQGSGNPSFFRINLGGIDFVFQYGSVSTLGLSNNTLVTYPISFTGGTSQVVVTSRDSTITNTENFMASDLQDTSFKITNTSNFSRTVNWLAYGLA